MYDSFHNLNYLGMFLFLAKTEQSTLFSAEAKYRFPTVKRVAEIITLALTEVFSTFLQASMANKFNSCNNLSSQSYIIPKLLSSYAKSTSCFLIKSAIFQNSWFRVYEGT